MGRSTDGMSYSEKVDIALSFSDPKVRRHALLDLLELAYEDGRCAAQQSAGRSRTIIAGHKSGKSRLLAALHGAPAWERPIDPISDVPPGGTSLGRIVVVRATTTGLRRVIRWR